MPTPLPNPIMRVTFDHQRILWAATYGGISRLDRATGNFITYTPEKQNTIQYQVIKEDSGGAMWLGAQSGLHRFDPRTVQFTIYKHDPDDLLFARFSMDSKESTGRSLGASVLFI